MGLTGLTPKKVFKYSERRVDVGVEGQTPKKFFHYNLGEAPSQTFPASLPSPTSSNENVDDINVPKFSPVRNASEVPDRPKTSRGKAHPSPDEFFDYVVPSPQQEKQGKKQDKKPKVVFFNEKVALSSQTDDEVLNEAAKRDQIRMLGCWLFGSALRV